MPTLGLPLLRGLWPPFPESPDLRRKPVRACRTQLSVAGWVGGGRGCPRGHLGHGGRRPLTLSPVLPAGVRVLQDLRGAGGQRGVHQVSWGQDLGTGEAPCFSLGVGHASPTASGCREATCDPSNKPQHQSWALPQSWDRPTLPRGHPAPAGIGAFQLQDRGRACTWVHARPFTPTPSAREMDDYIFVELDVGSEGNMDDEEIRQVLYSVIQAGSIASYVTSTEGFQFRRLGAGEQRVPRVAALSGYPEGTKRRSAPGGVWACP